MEIFQPGGSGSGTALTVTDGITPVVNVSTINFTSGATVTNGGGGTANVAVTGGASISVMVPTGAANGVNQSFIFSSTPSVIVVDDARVMNKVSKDGNVNWTGTTTVTMQVAPDSNIYGY